MTERRKQIEAILIRSILAFMIALAAVSVITALVPGATAIDYDGHPVETTTPGSWSYVLFVLAMAIPTAITWMFPRPKVLFAHGVTLWIGVLTVLTPSLEQSLIDMRPVTWTSSTANDLFQWTTLALAVLALVLLPLFSLIYASITQLIDWNDERYRYENPMATPGYSQFTQISLARAVARIHHGRRT